MPMLRQAGLSVTLEWGRCDTKLRTMCRVHSSERSPFPGTDDGVIISKVELARTSADQVQRDELPTH